MAIRFRSTVRVSLTIKFVNFTWSSGRHRHSLSIGSARVVVSYSVTSTDWVRLQCTDVWDSFAAGLSKTLAFELAEEPITAISVLSAGGGVRWTFSLCCNRHGTRIGSTFVRVSHTITSTHLIELQRTVERNYLTRADTTTSVVLSATKVSTATVRIFLTDSSQLITSTRT